MSTVRLRSVTGPPDTGLRDWLDRPVHRRSSWPALVRPVDRIVVEVDDAAVHLQDHPELRDVPDGAATAEAITAALLRAGHAIEWAEPIVLDDVAALLELSRRRGAHSVQVVRADPSLLTRMEIGAWTEAGWRTRVLRRVLARPAATSLDLRLIANSGDSGEVVGLAADIAFWAGVRGASTAAEWRRWTSSYVVLSYHRISDDRKAEQELIEVTPRRFARQMRLLLALRFRALAPDRLLALHEPGDCAAPRRGFVVTADDAFLDCTGPLLDACVEAQLFVPTADVGGTADAAWWREHPTPGWRVDDEPLADWERLREIERGGVHIGGHSRRHLALPTLPTDTVRGELIGSAEDLRRELTAPIPVMAYPHGLHSTSVRDAAKDAGFRLAFTTQFGRNGVGTDPWCLRRVPVFRDDGLLTFGWKILTGEPPPPQVVRVTGKLSATGRLLGRPSRSTLEETRRGRALLARVAGTSADRTHAVVAALDDAGIDAVLAGGWGVDALVGRQTRPHADLDVVVAHDVDVVRAESALRPLGYRLRSTSAVTGVAFDVRWAFRDGRGRMVDLLPVGGRAPFDDTQRRTGQVGGRPIACLSPAAQRAARTGYPARHEDQQALDLLDAVERSAG